MKRFLLGLLMTFVIGISHILAQDTLLKLKGISPSENDNISSFDFTLDFDISAVIATYGEDEYGIGWVGFHHDKLPTHEKSISLYEGDETTGTLLSRVCTSNFNGNTTGFESGSRVNISFPGLIPAEGKTYTLVITNEFKVYTKEKGATSLANTTLSYFSSPLKYTFIGGKASSENLSLVNSSIQSGSNVDKLSELTYTFNIPITIASTTPLQVREGDNIIGESNNMSVSEDKLSVTYKFADIPLYLSHIYSIKLPDGVVASLDNPNMINDAFEVSFNGSSILAYKLKSSTPANGDCSIFDKIECVFDMPENYIIYDNIVTTVNHKIYIYENAIDESNLIGAINGTVNSSNDGFVWNNTFSLNPEKEYILHIPEGQIKAYSTIDNKYAKDCANEEVIIEVKTPSIAESGLPPMEFQAPVLGQHGKDAVFIPGQKINKINTLEIALKDLKYDYNGVKHIPRVSADSKYYVYDITDGSNILLYEDKIFTQTRETTTSYYSVLKLNVDRTFFNGRKYKIVIPEGNVTISSDLIQNYVRNPEWSIEFEGSSPATVKLLSCTLQDNVELSALPVVIWEFEGEFVKNPELSAIQRHKYLSSVTGKPMETNWKTETLVTSINTRTQVAMLNYSSTGEPVALNTTDQYEVILPEGIIYLEEDPNIKNSELRYNIIPVEPQTFEKTEFVNLSVTINGLATSSQKTVKGEPVSVKLTPYKDWIVSALTRNGKNAIDFLEDGVYETPALTEDTEICAEVKYAGLWAVESTVDVWEIPESNISIFTEDGRIVVSGVTPDNKIMVYGVNGILIGSAQADTNTDTVTFSVEPGNIYIVIVDGKAAKLQL